jgi:hypothetical protein
VLRNEFIAALFFALSFPPTSKEHERMSSKQIVANLDEHDNLIIDRFIRAVIASHSSLHFLNEACLLATSRMTIATETSSSY